MNETSQPLAAETGVALDRAGSAPLVPPPKCNPRDSMRLVKRVHPGWPQAHYELTCGHLITVPTWANGRTSPKPQRKWYRCFKCRESRGWGRRFSEWHDKHGEAWHAANPDGQNGPRDPRGEETKA